MPRVLVTGALGQIGSELVPALRGVHGPDNVVATDIRMPTAPGGGGGPFEHLDSTDPQRLHDIVRKYKIGTIYHLSALLSAVAEERPQTAWQINMGSLYGVLEVARHHRCAVFFPSSIGAFGAGTPRDATPQDTIQRPSTIYGVTKVAGELLCDYYAQRFGVDVRGVRYPGLISYQAPPGGGTTDYAIHMYHYALKKQTFTCPVLPNEPLPMIYVDDAIEGTVQFLEAPREKLKRSV